MVRGHRAPPVRPPGSAGRKLAGWPSSCAFLPGRWLPGGRTMAGRTRACRKRLEEANARGEEDGDERPAEEPEAQEAQALQPDDDARTGRSRSRSVSRSRSRSRDRSPPAAELAAPTVQQVVAQCSWLEARDRGAGRSAAAPATTQDHVQHQPLSDPYQSLAAPATTQGHVANSLDQALATHRRFHQDLLQRLREGAQFRQLIGQMQREGVQQAAASRQRQLDFLARLGSNGQAPF